MGRGSARRVEAGAPEPCPRERISVRRSRTHSITMIMMWGASAAAFRAEAAWDSDNTASSGPRVDIIGS